VKTLEHGFQYVDNKEIYLSNIRKIVCMGDIACTPFTETSQSVLSEILRIETDLFLILGDIAFLGEEDEFKEIIEFCNQRAAAPVFSLCGNHDVNGFSQFCGLSTYALILDDFIILALDNARSTFREDSLQFVDAMLNKHAEKRFFLTFHVPPPTDLHGSCMRDDEWKKLKAVSDEYKDRIDCILAGHIHGFQEYTLDGYRIFISGGGGAALYDLENDSLKSYHAMEVTFGNNASFDIKVIPIEKPSGEIAA